MFPLKKLDYLDYIFDWEAYTDNNSDIWRLLYQIRPRITKIFAMELENLGNKISENMADQNLNWIYIVMGWVAKCRVQVGFRFWKIFGFGWDRVLKSFLGSVWIWHPWVWVGFWVFTFTFGGFHKPRKQILGLFWPLPPPS